MTIYKGERRTIRRHYINEVIHRYHKRGHIPPLALIKVLVRGYEKLRYGETMCLYKHIKIGERYVDASFIDKKTL